MELNVIGLVSAGTALVASMVSPFVTLAVAKRQFNANVLSTNRQKWIDTFRDHLAEFISVVSSAVTDSKLLVLKGNTDRVALDDAAHIRKSLERATRAYAQISLMTKGDDPNHLELMASAKRTLDTLLVEGPASANLMVQIDEVTRFGRDIIRREWGRVKRGI